MITCPWCGTNYVAFQSNCSNCGAPLPKKDEGVPASSEEVVQPPPAPRPISDGYVWKLLFSDGWTIASLILGFIGFIFGLVGAGLILGVVTALVGLPFFALGVIFVAGSAGVLIWRYGQARNIVNVLRTGEATTGQIISVQENYSVEVNGRHPWVIRYQFQSDSQNFEGNVTTMNPVGQSLQEGKPVCVLYLPTTPQWNSIYPHP